MESTESILLHAAAFAANKHADQRRKNLRATPYINHPVEVAALLANEGGVTDLGMLVAAILHDTVEDTDTTFQEIEKIFGSDVKSLVAEVTDDKSLEKQRRKQLQVEQAPHKSDRAKQLKVADKTCNIRDMDHESPEGWDLARKTQYLSWAEQVIEHCRGINAPLERQFDLAIGEARKKLSQTNDNVM